MYSGGGKGKTPSAYQKANSDGSQSSSSDDDNVEELIRDQRRIEGQSIKKVGNKGSDYSSSSGNESYDDDLEADDGETSINHRIGPQTYETEDSFVVDENGNSMKQVVHVIGASSKGSLNSDHLKEVYNLIKPNSTNFQTFVERKRKNVRSEIIKAQTQDLNIENNFERELYNCSIKSDILPSTIEWIFATCFKSRTNSGSDENLNEDSDDETNETKVQKRILENILHNMLSDPDEDGYLQVIYTPQYIIKHKSDIFKVQESIYTNDDIFTILSSLKRYKWLYHKYLSFESIQQIYEDFEPDLKMYTDEVMSSSVSNELINDMTRFNSYSDSSGNSGGAQSIYFRQKKLFKELVDEFLLIPEKVAYKLYLSMNNSISHAESIDPPEPTLPPDIRLETFLKSNDEYRDLLETEINAGRNNYEDDNFDMHTEMLNRLKEQIIRYASTDLSINPILLSAIREQITENVVVRTYPTEKGENSSTMLPYGIYGPVKRLKDKMISSFHHTDVWLLIKEAEEKGFLTVEIDYYQGIQQFLETLKKKFYLSQYGSQWDDLRQTIMDRAFKQSIWPQFKRETEEDLYTKAAESVRDDVEAELTKKFTAPPYTKLSAPNAGIQTLVGVTVLSLCYHPDIPNEIGIALVDPMGNVTSHSVENSYMLRNQIRPEELIDMLRNEKNSKKKNQNQPRNDEKLTIQQKAEYDGKKHIIQMIENAQPDIVTICATHLKSRDLFMIVQNLLNIAVLPHDHPRIKVLFAPSDAALIYARSPVSRMERRDLSQQQQISDTVLIAASTARRVQNPLSELTRLCTPDKNYLVNLPLHRFQSKFLNESTETGIIYEACELACIKAVAISGVDVSKLHSMHHRGALQFLPGFGPKFANFILNKFTSTSADKKSIRSRISLEFDMDDCPHISRNAISFLRFPGQIKKVRRDDRDDQSRDRGNNEDKLLNGTMIDPKEYQIAYDMIKFFSKNENGGHKYTPDTEIDENKVRQFFMTPHHEIQMSKLPEFMHSDFYSPDDMSCHRLIKFIAKELNIGPFETLRFKKRKIGPDQYKPISQQFDRNGMFHIHDSLLKFNSNVRSIIDSPDNFYCPMTDVELFDALINDPSIKEHSVSEFRILKYVQNDNSCLARTQNSDVDAVATNQFSAFSEDKDIQHIKEKVFKGAILQIDKSQMKLVVSFNPRDLESMKTFDRLTPYIDNNFDFTGEEEAQRLRKEAEKNKPHRYYQRLVEDEHFRNKTPEQAEAELMTLQVGDYIIRPSTRAVDNDRLVLMIRFPSTNFGIYEIIERGKKGKDDLTLGKKLSIDKNEFDDLEDIQWNFVQQIQEKLAKIVQHKRYVEDFETAINQITADRQANPKSIPYRITNDPSIRSCVCFIWLYKDGTLVQEPIRLTPFEYRYRHQSFASLDKIINNWKENKCRLPTEEEMKTFSLARYLTDAEEEKKKEAEEKNNQTVRSYGTI